MPTTMERETNSESTLADDECCRRQAEVDSLWFNVNQQADRIRLIEKRFDTLDTPLWRRILFRIDGWPAWYRVVTKPQWRPWHRWWHS